jgi:NADP-dependent 3-hydroxy acid dehydrogenase YdfG
MQNIPNPQQLFDVKDKVAVVTGATGAFGEAAARGLAKAGAKVMCTARKVETLEPLVQSITEAGFEAIYEAGDPVVHDDVKRVVTKTVEAYGGIDILVTAAGLNKVGAIIEQPVEDWQTVMDVNVKGTYLYCKEVGKVLVEQGRGGKVIIVSSARSSLGMANYTAYSPPGSNKQATVCKRIAQGLPALRRRAACAACARGPVAPAELSDDTPSLIRFRPSLRRDSAPYFETEPSF